MTSILLAIIIGGAFGFVLDRVGATNPDYIIGMLRLSNLHLMKTILLAIAVGALLMFAGLLAGLLDAGHMSVKGAYWGVVVGGALLGVGFAVAGYCPGTGLAAAATGRTDAFVFILGGLVGAGLYMLTFGWVESTGLLAAVFGGKSTLGALAGTDYPALWPSVSGEWLGIGLAVLLGGVAFLLPMRLRGGRRGGAKRGADSGPHGALHSR